MREEAHAAEQRTRGRPRDLETERRILEVALRMLREDGYTRMSVDAVALEAGVSKPTIYRRWASKADLATAAVRTLQLAEAAVDTGRSKWDLVQTLENFRRSLLRPNGMSLIGTVLAEEAHTPDPAITAGPASRAARSALDLVAVQHHGEAELQHFGVGQARVGHVGLHHARAVKPAHGLP